MSARYAGKPSLFAEARRDVPAGVVVFLVAVPFCLGIAQASGVTPLPGLIAGIVGGLVVASISRSHLSVSGPSAGLAVIVTLAMQTFDPNFSKTGQVDLAVALPPFLMAVVLSGVIQLALGALRLGSVAHYFPNAVIKGMLASIGILSSLKQLPHAVGFDSDYEGDLAFSHGDGHNTFTDIVDAMGALSPTATAISVVCFGVCLGWPRLQVGVFRLVPSALVVVLLGALMAVAAPWIGASYALGSEHLVNLPVTKEYTELYAHIAFPALSRFNDPVVWKYAFMLAFVASIETLLCLEAVDRLDPRRRISPPNRELIAQGVGNIASGLVGGLPVTSVIVRSSANVAAGGQTRLAAMVHGALLLIGVVFAATLLNYIPMASLAVILMFVGYKLSPPSLWKAMYRGGSTQFVPFVVTVAAVVFTDLLIGTLIGLCVGVVFAIRQQQRGAVVVSGDDRDVTITLTKDLSFLNKASLKEALGGLRSGANVTIDRRVVDFLDDDIIEILLNFEHRASERGINVTILSEKARSTRRELLAATKDAIDDAMRRAADGEDPESAGANSSASTVVLQPDS